MENEEFKTFYGHLQENAPEFQGVGIEQFKQAVSDPQAFSTFYKNFQDSFPEFKEINEEQFRQSIGFPKEEPNAQAGQSEEKPGFWSRMAKAWNPKTSTYDSEPGVAYDPDREGNTIMQANADEVKRPDDYVESQEESSWLSKPFYSLSDEDLQKQIAQLEEIGNKAMKPIYDAFEKRTGHKYNPKGGNSDADETIFRNITESMKSAELMKRGYYNAGAMRREKIKEEVDELFEDNSPDTKQARERLARLRQERAWRSRQEDGSYTKLGRALEQQKNTVLELAKAGPEDFSLTGAKKYLDDAIKLYNAPSAYGESNGFVNWAKGLGDQIINYDTWTAGATEMARIIDLNRIVNKLDKGEKLTDSEEAKLNSFLLYNATQEARQEDISKGYNIGKGSAESIPFMAEMLITAGIGAAAKKAIIKNAINTGNKTFARRMARAFGEEIAEETIERNAKKEVVNFATKEAKQGILEKGARQVAGDVAMTATMPTTWTAITEEAVDKKLRGEEFTFSDALRTFANQTVETGTERWGGKLVDNALGKAMPLDKIWGKTRWGKLLTNDFIQSPIGETGEEYVGAAVNYLRSFNPLYSDESNEQLRHDARQMFSIDGLTQTFLTVLPMSALGGVANVIEHKKTISEYKAAKGDLLTILQNAGSTKDEAEDIVSKIESADDSRGFTARLEYSMSALRMIYQEQHPDATLEEQKAYFKKLDEAFGRYFQSAFYLNELGGEIKEKIDNLDDNMKQEVIQAVNNEINEQTKRIGNQPTPVRGSKRIEVKDANNKKVSKPVNYSADNLVLKDDGTIDETQSENLVLKDFRGNEIKGKQREEWLEALNAVLANEHDIEARRIALQKQEEERKQSEDRKEKERLAKLNAETEKKIADMQESIKGVTKKNGDINMNEATPAQVVFFLHEKTGDINQTLDIVAARIIELNNEMGKKGNAVEKWQLGNKINEYYAAVGEWIGEPEKAQVQAAVNQALNVEQKPVVEEAPKIEQLQEPVKQEAPAAEEAPVVEETQEPVVEKTPVVEETPQEEPQETPAEEAKEEPIAEEPAAPVKEEPATDALRPFDENGNRIEDVVLIRRKSKAEYKLAKKSEIPDKWREAKSQRVVYVGADRTPALIRVEQEKFSKEVPIYLSNGKQAVVPVQDILVKNKDGDFVSFTRSDWYSVHEVGTPKSFEEIKNQVIFQRFTFGDLLNIGYEAFYTAVDKETGKGIPSSVIDDIHRAIVLWNRYVAGAAQKSKSIAALKPDDLARYRAMQYAILKSDRSAAAAAHDMTRLAQIEERLNSIVLQVAMISSNTAGKATDAVLKKATWENPLNRLVVAMELAQKLGYIQESELPDMQLPEELEKEASMDVITSAELEKMREQYNADKAAGKGLAQYDNFPELAREGQLVSRYRFVMRKKKGGGEAEVNGYDDVKGIYKNIDEAADVTKTTEQAAKEYEQYLKDLSDAYQAYQQGNGKLLSKINKNIATAIKAHPKDANYTLALAWMNGKIAQEEATKYPALAQSVILHQEIAEIEQKIQSVNDDIAAEEKKAEEEKREPKRLAVAQMLPSFREQLAAKTAELDALNEQNPDLDAAYQEYVQTERPQQGVVIAFPTKEQRGVNYSTWTPVEVDRKAVSQQIDELTKQHEALQEELKNTKQRARQNELKAQMNDLANQIADLRKQLVRPKVQLQTGENVPMAEFTEAEKKSKQARLAYNALVAALQRIKGLNLHMVGSQAEARRVLEMIQGIPELMSVYHGTGAVFDKFDLSFVGSGEGNQAFGFGNYVTKRYSVARGYADITKNEPVGSTLNSHGFNVLNYITLNSDEFEGKPTLNSAEEHLSDELYKNREEKYEFVIEMSKYIPEIKQYVNHYEEESDDDVDFRDQVITLFDLLYDYAQNTFLIERFGVPMSETEYVHKCNRLYRRHMHLITLYDALMLLEGNGVGAGASMSDALKKAKELLNQKRPYAYILDVEIPDDNGSNYLPWHEDIPEDERKRIADELKARGVITEDWEYESIVNPQDERTGIRLGVKGGDIYRAIEWQYERVTPIRRLFDGKDIDINNPYAIVEEMIQHLPTETGLRPSRGSDKHTPRGQAESVIKMFVHMLSTKGDSLPLKALTSVNSVARTYAQNGAIKDEEAYLKFCDAIQRWLTDNLKRFSTEKKRADKLTSEFLSSIGYVGNKVPIGYAHQHRYKGEENMNYIIFNDNDLEIEGREKVEFFRAKDGTIYGWSIGNDMYLTDEGLNPETPIHEYTHIWLNALKAGNKAAYDKVLRAIKARKGLWEKVTKDPAYAHLTTDEEIASEVLARYSGKRGAARLMEVANELYGQNPDAEPTTLTKTFISKMQSILKEFWDAVKGLFGIKSMDDISDWVLKDLFDGKPLDFNTEEMQAIKDKAIADGTFMKTPDGRDTKLTERQWLMVRTKAFKEWYGDWENPKEGEFFLLDGNEYMRDPETGEMTYKLAGEPLVVYHGSDRAGFDIFDPKDVELREGQEISRSNGRGIFLTSHYPVASVYTTKDGNPDITTDEALIGDDPHHGIYSLYNNMHNPLIIDCSDEEGNPSMYWAVPTGKYKVVGADMPTIYFDSYDEAAQWMYDNGFGVGNNEEEFEPEIVPDVYTTDQIVSMAQGEGYDGVVFLNILDGGESTKLLANDNEAYMQGHDVMVAFAPNQVKSATQNSGLFSMQDARIEYQYSSAMLNEHDDKATKANERSKMNSAFHEAIANPAEGLQVSKFISEYMDMMEGMRVLQDNLTAYLRMTEGVDKLPAEYDIRNMFESKDSIAMNAIRKFNKTLAAELNEAVIQVQEAIGKTDFYKAHKKEVGGEHPADLTPIEFVGRYLIARNDYERAKEGTARGMEEFYERMGMTTEEFWRGFHENVDESLLLNLWDKIKQVTDFELDVALEGQLITGEEYDRLKAKQFYVPQRGFWDDVNPENKEEKLEVRHEKGMSKIQLSSMNKARGGKSLAENPLVYIYRDANEAIVKSENNKVKIALFNMLTEQRTWCEMPEVGFDAPVSITYRAVEGDFEKLVDGYTEEDRKKMREIKKRIDDLKRRIDNTTGEPETEVLDALIDLNDQLAAIESNKIDSEFMNDDIRKIYNHKNRDEKRNTIGVLINGVQHEIVMPEKFALTAQAFNGRRNTEGVLGDIRTATSFLAAQFTVNNPTFWTVNFTRDVLFVELKGGTEYGPEFNLWFSHYLYYGQGALNRYLKKGYVEGSADGQMDAWMREFLDNGGNTGLFNDLDLEKFRYDVRHLDPKAKTKWEKAYGGFYNAYQIATLQPVANYMNELSELTSRFAIFCAAKRMGMDTNEAVNASHNLSVNFNRRGLGNQFLNIFSTITPFVNATIQGTTGFWRTFGAGYGATHEEKIKKALKAGCVMAALPAFLGCLNAVLCPDDPDDVDGKISEWDRMNYVCFPNGVRIPLPQEIRPFWAMGVNIGLLIRGQRTTGEFANSLFKSALMNGLPLPQNISEAGVLLIDDIMGGEYNNLGQIGKTLVQPSFMGTLGQIAENRNFLGGKLRYDIKDFPEYEMAPNESFFYRFLSYVAYVVGFGDTNTPSKHRNTKIDSWWSNMSPFTDVNPKEWKSYLFVIPSGVLDMYATAFGGIYAGIDAVRGEYDEKKNYLRAKDAFIANKFYRPANKDGNRYAAKKEAKAFIDKFNNVQSNALNSAYRFAATGEDERSKASVDRYATVTEDYLEVVTRLKKDYELLQKISRQAVKNQLHLSDNTELNDVVGIDAYNSLDDAEKEIVIRLNHDLRVLKDMDENPSKLEDINVIDTTGIIWRQGRGQTADGKNLIRDVEGNVYIEEKDGLEKVSIKK